MQGAKGGMPPYPTTYNDGDIKFYHVVTHDSKQSKPLIGSGATQKSNIP